MKNMNEQRNLCMWGNVQLLLKNVLEKLAFDMKWVHMERKECHQTWILGI